MFTTKQEVAYMEAKRLARNIIKDTMKELGIRIAVRKDKDITDAAMEYISAEPDVMWQAAKRVGCNRKQAERVLTHIRKNLND